MEEIKFELDLKSSDSNTEILELYEFIGGEVYGLKKQLKQNPRST
jgi:hypothetical protein